MKKFKNIECLWKKSKEILDENITLLILSVIDKYLELEFDCTEMTKNN